MVLCNMKRQLTKCRRGDLKKFRYRSLLVSFFLERVPLLQLQVDWGLPAPQDPRMMRWCNLMARHVAGPIIKYNDLFFDWLRPQMLMIDDYAYANLDFRGDLDLVLPEDAQWGDLGKKYTFCSFFNVFCKFYYIKCFYIFDPRTNQKSYFDDTEVGPYRPLGTSPIQRQGEVAPVARWDAEDYEAVEQNLEGLTADVPDIAIGEIPRRYKCHIVGMSKSFIRLLHRVARAVVCYCERHP
jgi:hypothetical protein